jgi:hypothetical protein
MKYTFLLLTLFLLNIASYANEDAWESFFDGSKTIHLKFTDVIDDKYTVNVLWNPNDGNVPRLVGPATIRFVKDSGSTFSVSVDAFHLPLDVLNKLGLLKFDDSGDYHTLPVDLTKVYPVEYNTIGKDSLFDSFHGNNVPFFFEDIDFDGKDELIVVDFGNGQRRVDDYKVYKPTYKNGNMYNLAIDKPFDMLDQKTAFNKENRTIDVFLSGGACGSTNEKFKLIGNKYVAIEFTDWDYYIRDGGSVCVESNYVVIDGVRVLKSKSESYTEFGSGKTIELGTKYY